MTEYFTKDGDEYKKVDSNLLTQTDVDNVLEKRLERERGKFADYESLKEKASKVDTVTREFEDKLKSAGAEKSDLQSQLKKSQLDVDRIKVVHEFKLSDDLAEFVTGDTPDELRQRAEKLSHGIKGGKIVTDKEPKPVDKDATDSGKIAKGLFGNKSGE